MDDFYKKFDRETRILFAGDACMNPYELFDKRHAYFEYYYRARMKEDNPREKDTLSAYERLQELRGKLKDYKRKYLKKEFSSLDESATRIITKQDAIVEKIVEA